MSKNRQSHFFPNLSFDFIAEEIKINVIKHAHLPQHDFDIFICL